MGKGNSVTLGRFTFRTKTAAKQALRDIRDASPDRIPILDDDAVDLLLGVLAAHPQSTEKVGVGVAGFFAARSPDFPSRCFYVRRTDGSETDFSWNEAITPTTPIVRLRMACRNAINAHRLSFRDQAWPIGEVTGRICPITGDVFERTEAHIDHQPPQTLMALVESWLGASHLSVAEVPIIHTGDLRSVDTFADGEQESSWVAYHQANAILRLVSASGNLRQGARLINL